MKDKAEPQRAGNGFYFTLALSRVVDEDPVAEFVSLSSLWHYDPAAGFVRHDHGRVLLGKLREEKIDEGSRLGPA